MMSTSTQGTDRKTKSITVDIPDGQVEQPVLPAAPGILYRVVEAQVSMNGAGDVLLYHGASFVAAKVIAAAYLASGVPLVADPGDWAVQAGEFNEAVSADVQGATARITLIYVEISNQQ